MLYVQSRGTSRSNDYRWLRIEGDRQYPETPQSLTLESFGSDKKTRLADLIDSQGFSLILARSPQSSLLLITGLLGKQERVDAVGRRIRHSLLSILPATEDSETIHRSLAVRALQDSLAAQLDEAIAPRGDYGFTVASDQIEELLVPKEINFLEPESDRLRLGNNSPQLRESLALELQQHRLPPQFALLVVVTGIKTEAALREVGVWRGLSNRIPSETWITVEINKEENGGFFWKIGVAIAVATLSAIGFLTLLGAEKAPTQPTFLERLTGTE